MLGSKCSHPGDPSAGSTWPSQGERASQVQHQKAGLGYVGRKVSQLYSFPKSSTKNVILLFVDGLHYKTGKPICIYVYLLNQW